MLRNGFIQKVKLLEKLSEQFMVKAHLIEEKRWYLQIYTRLSVLLILQVKFIF